MSSQAGNGRAEKNRRILIAEQSADRGLSDNCPKDMSRGYPAITRLSDPGGIYTDLARDLPAEELAFDGELKTAEQGAATTVWCATSSQLDGKGGVYCMDVDIAEVISDFTPEVPGQQPTGVLPWAVDPELAERLWVLSEQLTGVKFSR